MKITDLQFYSGINSEPNIFFKKDSFSNISIDNVIYPLAEFETIATITWDDGETTNPQSIRFSEKILLGPTIAGTASTDFNKEYIGGISLGESSISDIIPSVITSNQKFSKINSSETGQTAVQETETNYFSETFSTSLFESVTDTAGLIVKRIRFSTAVNLFYVGFLNKIVVYDVDFSNIVYNVDVSFDLIDISFPDPSSDVSIYAISSDNIYKINLGTSLIQIASFSREDASDYRVLSSPANIGLGYNFPAVYAATVSGYGKTLLVDGELVDAIPISVGDDYSTLGIQFNDIVNVQEGDDHFFLITENGDLLYVQQMATSRFANQVNSNSDSLLSLDYIANFSGVFEVAAIVGSSDGIYSFNISIPTAEVMAKLNRNTGNSIISTGLQTISATPAGTSYRVYMGGRLNSDVTSFSGKYDDLTIDLANGTTVVSSPSETDLTYADQLIPVDTIIINTISNAGIYKTNTNMYFGRNGLGIGESVIAKPEEINALHINFDFVLQDYIKTDKNKYLMLFNERGSSLSDSNSILCELDDLANTVRYGLPGYGQGFDKIWKVANYILFRSSDNRSVYFFLPDDTLDLNNFITGGGFVGTTYAGEIIDILYKRDLYYIIGTAGIEVWENTGAATFPFRKQDYLSIPYHGGTLFLSENEEISDAAPFIPKVSTSYKNQFAAIVNSNEDNQLQILILSGGHFTPFKFDFAKIFKFINISSSALGFGIESINLWGQEFLVLISFDSNISSANYFIINDKGFCYRMSSSGISDELEFLMRSSFNGMRLLYNDNVTSKEIFVQSGDDNFSPISDELLIFTMLMDSSLIRSQTSDVIQVRSILIRLSYPHGPLDTYVDTNGDVYVDTNGDAYVATEYLLPDGAEYNISISSDEGTVWTVIKTYSGAQITDSLKTIVITNLGTYGSVMVRFESNIPINVLSAAIKYEEVGVTI